MNLRTLLGMPSSTLPPRLVTPHRGVDTRDPKQALTPEELAQVRADLALVEPHRCMMRYENRLTGYVTSECGKPAVVEHLYACGRSTYYCREHVDNPDATNPGRNPTGHMICPQCRFQGQRSEHLTAVLPC